MNKVYVNCGGSLYSFNSKKEVMSFFESCINCSEGSERERYTTIYFDVKSNLNTNKRCFSDNTSFVYNSDIKASEIDDTDEKLLIKNFDISKEDLLAFEANNYLYNNKLESVEDIYDTYIKDNKKENRTFYVIDKEKIICIDDNISDTEYYSQIFPIKDYLYADLWLKGDIEYEDYLSKIKQNDKEIY